MYPACPAQVFVSKFKLNAAEPTFIEKMTTAVLIGDNDGNKGVLGDDIYFIKELLANFIFEIYILVISVFIYPNLPIVATAIIYTPITCTSEVFEILRLRYLCFAHFYYFFLSKHQGDSMSAQIIEIKVLYVLFL